MKKKKIQPSAKRKGNAGLEKDSLPWLPWAWATGILLLTFYTFSPTLDNDWTNWDDEVYVLNNPHIKEFNGKSIATLFDPDTRTLANYDPVSMLTLAWDFDGAKRSDGNGGYSVKAKPFHRTSLLFHLLNTFLVFLWLFHLFDKKLMIPVIGALLFGIHPMHVEAVAWISARKEVVFTFFFLISLITYTRHAKKQSWLMLGLALLAFLLSALSKPTAVVLPIVLLGLDWYLGRKWEMKSILEKLPFLAISIWIGLLTIQGQADANALSGLEGIGFGQRILFTSYGLVMYAIKAIIPFGLSAVHPYPDPENLSFIFYLAPVLLLAMLGGLFLFWRKKKKGMLFGAFFFLISIVLVLQILSFGHALMAERFTYLPYIGLFVLLALLADWAIKKYSSLSALKWGIYAGFGAFSILCISISQEQVKVWKNSEVLWTQTIDRYPDLAAIAYNNRGLFYKQNTQFKLALADYNQALSIDKGKHLYFNNRGNLYRELAEQGKHEQDYLHRSIADHSKAVELKPDDADGFNSRGLSHLDLGDEKAAMADFSKSLELDPDNDPAYLNRGVLYLNDQDLEPALADFDRYLANNPSDFQILNLRGYTRFRLGKFSEALLDQDMVINASPNNGSYYMFRAFTLDTLGRAADALSDARRAAELGAVLEAGFLEKLEGKVPLP